MLGEAVRDGLRQESYVVDWVQDGGAALAALSTAAFAALVLDLGLPRSDGLSVLRWLRQSGNTTPVVIVTARDRVTDRITGLDAGADDYLIKPLTSMSWPRGCEPLLAGRSAMRSPYSPWVT